MMIFRPSLSLQSVFPLRHLCVCVADAENVSCGIEIRAGTGSALFPFIVKEQWEREALEI